MSALLTPPARRFGEPEFDDGRFHDSAADGEAAGRDDDAPTLDDVISRAWEVLRADVPAACPVCGGELLPRASAGAGVVGGRCGSCGTTLS